jgi:hypothetical protein
MNSVNPSPAARATELGGTAGTPVQMGLASEALAVTAPPDSNPTGSPHPARHGYERCAAGYGRCRTVNDRLGGQRVPGHRACRRVSQVDLSGGNHGSETEAQTTPLGHTQPCRLRHSQLGDLQQRHSTRSTANPIRIRDEEAVGSNPTSKDTASKGGACEVDLPASSGNDQVRALHTDHGRGETTVRPWWEDRRRLVPRPSRVTHRGAVDVGSAPASYCNGTWVWRETLRSQWRTQHRRCRRPSRAMHRRGESVTRSLIAYDH